MGMVGSVLQREMGSVDKAGIGERGNMWVYHLGYHVKRSGGLIERALLGVLGSLGS